MDIARTKTRSETLQILRAWLLDLDRNHGLSSIDPNENIVECGLIDSLEFINFLYIIEEQRGLGIPASILQLEKFKTLNSIIENFF
jgi:acyl carrier protein